MPEWEDDEVEVRVLCYYDPPAVTYLFPLQEIMLLAPKATSRSAALLVTPASSDPELGCPLVR